MPRKKQVSRLDYGQYILSSQINYTQTYMAEHHDRISHDAVNRWMRDERISSSELWEHAKPNIEEDPGGYLVFDDTVLDKDYSHKISLVRRQYSGNAHEVIKGIGVVNCVYVNPNTGRFWVIDYRIYAPDFDGKSKLDHVREMFDNALYRKKLAFRTVLMDSWYATSGLMAHIHNRGKFFYCPVKDNRRIFLATGEWQSSKDIEWSGMALKHGRFCHLKGSQKDINMKLFRIVRSTTEFETIVTNDVSQSSAQDAQKVVALRWKVEQFHREIKQTTGIEACQCRNHRSQRTHIAVCMLVWLKLTDIAQKAKISVYRLKNSLLDEYMKIQLKSPAIRFA